MVNKKLKKILILVGGNKKKIEAFSQVAEPLGIDLTIGSFSQLKYYFKVGTPSSIKIGKYDLASFDLIYFRMIGRRIEDAAMISVYARGKNIPLVDPLYENSLNYPASVAKSLETKKLIDANIPVPSTYFASLDSIKKNARRLFGYPYVIKSTTGKKARDTWLVNSLDEVNKLNENLIIREKEGIKFFAQKFIATNERIRVLVIGNSAVGALVRPTKWVKKLGMEPGRKVNLSPIPKGISELAINSARAAELDISGVDILKDKEGKLFVIEANAAPSWKLIKSKCNINVERLILELLLSKLSGGETAENIKKQYQDKYRKFGFDPRALSWKSRGAAHQRFRQMWTEIDFNSQSVLDVGCGFGEMAKFLGKRYEGVSYTGVDIVSEFISKAKKQFPNYNFETRDYFKNPLEKKFDVVLASGVLNSNVANNMEYRKKAIKVMFDHTSKILAFNMLGGHPQPETKPKSNVWYADSLEILNYCLSLTRRVILRHNYHPKDFTIIMYKKA